MVQRQGLPLKSTFSWSAVDIIDEDNNKNDPWGYDFADSSGDEYEEMQATASVPATSRAVKLRKLMDAEIEAVC